MVRVDFPASQDRFESCEFRFADIFRWDLEAKEGCPVEAIGDNG